MPVATSATTRVLRPRPKKPIPEIPSTAPKTKKTATTTAKKPAAPRKKTPKVTTANTSKPRTKKAATARVTKTKGTPPAEKKSSMKKTAAPKASASREPSREPTILEKAEGVFKKALGTVIGDTEMTAAGTAKLGGTEVQKSPAKSTKV